MKIKRHNLENIVPFIFSFVSFLILTNYWEYEYYNFIGIIIIIIGLIIWWMGKLALGDAFSARPKAKKLVNKSIYSRIKHPIYLGLSLTLLGWSVFLFSYLWITVTFISVIILFIRAYKEEKVLVKKFSKEYLNYKKKTWF